MCFPSGTVVKNLPAKAGEARDLGSTPVSGRSPGRGNGNSLQHSCLGNSMSGSYSPWGPKEFDTTEQLTLFLGAKKKKKFVVRALNTQSKNGIFSLLFIVSCSRKEKKK